MNPKRPNIRFKANCFKWGNANSNPTSHWWIRCDIVRLTWRLLDKIRYLWGIREQWAYILLDHTSNKSDQICHSERSVTISSRWIDLTWGRCWQYLTGGTSTLQARAGVMIILLVNTPELSIPNSEYIPSLQKMGRFQLENLIANTLFWTDSQKGKQLKA